jgi:hypothetical protein
MRGAKDRIVAAVASWPDVTTEPGRFGATVFKKHRREVGHIHGDSVVDIPVRKEQAEAWIAEGRAVPHRFAPNFGVTVFIKDEPSLINALELLRASYDVKS